MVRPAWRCARGEHAVLSPSVSGGPELVSSRFCCTDSQEQRTNVSLNLNLMRVLEVPAHPSPVTAWRALSALFTLGHRMEASFSSTRGLLAWAGWRGV